MPEETDPAIAAIRKRLERYVTDKPFRFNPDAGMVDSIIAGIADRKRQHGREYCPCRRVTGNKEEDRKIICPCVYHLGELEADGHCHCNLFVKP